VSHLGDVDVFYHLWDYDTLPSLAHGYVKKPLPVIMITEEQQKELFDTLNPKAFEISPAMVFPKFDETKSKIRNPIAWWTRSQFYSLKKCAFLKHEYEVRNNFEYDLVCRIRTDLFLDYVVPSDLVIKPNTLYSCVNQHDIQFQTYRIGDIFYFADSFTYDQVSNYYDAFDYIDALDVVPGHHVYPPELAFYYYIKSMGISNVSVHAPAKIMRTKQYAKLKGTLAEYEIS
jgi:hypothetical protein